MNILLKSRHFLLFSLVAAACLAAAFVAFNTKAAKTQADVTVRAAGRGRPFLNLRDGYALKTDGTGDGAQSAQTSDGSTRPLALAAGDFDIDGAPDLLSGYAAGAQGFITLRRGNLDAFAPSDAAVFAAIQQGRMPNSFLPATRTFAVPEAPDFLATGDFNHDSLRDVLSATRGGGLYLLAGDGAGNFAAATKVKIGGGVTALVAGGFDRGDGLSDVVVGVNGAAGPEILIYTVAGGGLQARPSRYALSAPATSFALGTFDKDSYFDLAVAAGQEVLLIHASGGTRKTGSKLAPLADIQTRVEHVALPFEARALAAGYFVWNREQRQTLAVLAADGSIHLLQPAALDRRPYTPAELTEQSTGDQEVLRVTEHWDARPLPAVWRPGAEAGWELGAQIGTSAPPADGASPQALLAASFISYQPTADLFVVNAGRKQINLLRHLDEQADAAQTARALDSAAQLSVALNVASQPVAFLEMPRKVNGERDLVLLQSDSLAPTIVPAAPLATISVDRTDDVAAASACTGNANDCSLRGAVTFANVNAGTVINVPTGTYNITLSGAEDANATGDLDLLPGASGVAFVGAGAPLAIIQVNQASAPNERIFQVTPGTVATVGWTGTWSGLTMQNGGSTTNILSGGAILMGGTDNIYNVFSCTFNNNDAAGNIAGNGGAISQSAKQNGGCGQATFVNNTFTGNVTAQGIGGAIRNLGGTTTPGTEFTNITGGLFDNNQATTNAGGAIAHTLQAGTSNYSKIQFTNNKAYTTGAPSTDNGGGAISKSNGTINVNFCRFRGNVVGTQAMPGSGEGVQLGGNGDLNAVNNWWGCNVDPQSAGANTAGCDTAFKVSTVTGTLTTLPQLVLKNTANPAPIVTGQDTTLTASVNTNSANQDVSQNVIALVDLPVTWGNAVRGNLSNLQTALQSLTRTISTATESGSTVTITTSVAHGFSSGQTVLIAGVSDSRYTGTFTIASTPTTTTFTYTNPITGLSASSGGTAKVSVGTATATFRASAAGAGAADATAENAVATANFTINKADTTTTLTSDTPDPTVTGQPFTVNFSLVVNAPGSNVPTVPTGNVTVTADTGETCTGAINSATPATGSCSIMIFNAGNRTLTAAYQGDANFNVSPASSPATAHVVNKADTTTVITNSVALGTATVTGQPYAVNYSVSVTAPGSAGGTFNTGQVQVSDGVSTCTGTVLAGTCNLTSTSAGAKTITATYLGDANYNASPTSPGVGHTVNPANTTTTITNTVALGTATVVGQAYAVNWSVSVNSPGSLGVAMTGNVTVSDGAQTCMAAVSAGTCNLTSTTAGPKTITATYGGDSNYNASPASAGVSHTVNKANTTTAITNSVALGTATVVGQAYAVNWSVSVTSPGAGTPTGTVQVSDGTNTCSAAIGAGTCNLTSLTSGAKNLTATYQGDSDFNMSPASPTVPHQVNKADTTASISSTVPNPSVTGQAVQVNFSVLVTAPGGGTPTGTVTIKDGASTFCMAAVAAGNCSAAFTSAGPKTLTATYGGDSNYNASPASSDFAHQVNKADTTATITGDTPDPSTPGQNVTVTYTVGVTAPGAGTPTGNVQVTDGVDSCIGTVAAGQCTVALTTQGNRTLTATYQGDTNFNASPASAGAPHLVQQIQVIISEFRFRGSRSPSGAQDEFIELYNNSDSQVVVPVGGWTLRSTDTIGTTATVFTIPAATTIPARGHFLIINNTASVGFSLGGYPAGAGTVGAGDGQYTGIDIADGGGIALFSSGSLFDATTQLDAVGFNTTPNTLYREGTGLAPAGGVTADGEYSFVRKLTSGTPQDTADNAADFDFVGADGGTFSGRAAIRGGAGPESLASPIQRNATIKSSLIDPAVASTSPPNRIRDNTSGGAGTPTAFGTLEIRRKFTNTTGGPVTKLRFRVADITTTNSPNQPLADLRVLSIGGTTVTITGGAMINVLGTTVEMPPTQPNGGGSNSSIVVAIPGGTLANGASVNVRFVLGVFQTGNFRFFVNVEALP